MDNSADFITKLSQARLYMVEAKIKLLAAKLSRIRAEAAAGMIHAGSTDLGSTELIRKHILAGRIESDPKVVIAIDELLKAEAEFLRREADFLNLEAEYKLQLTSDNLQ